MGFSTRRMRPSDWKEIKHFKSTEFKHPERMGFEFVRWLDAVASKAGTTMIVSSSYRSPTYNKTVGGAKHSAHTDEICNTVDIRKAPSIGDPNWNRARFAIIFAAYELGCTRFGTYKDGSIHLDRTEDTRPGRVMWTVVDNPA